ncbi:putative cytochrome P450-dependent fatty acid hydroxylase [Balamuthia mandrillaris]
MIVLAGLSWWVLLGAAVVLTALLVATRRDIQWRTGGIPGPAPLPFLGNTFTMVKNADRLNDWFLEQTHQHGHTWVTSVTDNRIVMVIDPDSVDYFLNRNFKNYIRGPLRKESLWELLGEGIFVADGREWMLHRKLAKPLFRSANIQQSMVPVFAHHLQQHLLPELLRTSSSSSNQVNLYNMFMEFTMSTFMELGLGCSAEDHLSQETRKHFAQAFEWAQEEALARNFKPWWKWTISKQFKESIRFIDEVIYGVIRERKKDTEEELKQKTDIFSQFMLLSDDDGQPLSDRYLRDVFLNFLLAGRDTTATVLSWAFYELAMNPAVQERLLEHIHQVMKDTDIPTAEEISQLSLARQVITETLRLHPSVPQDSRFAVKEDVLPNGTKIKARDEVAYSSWVMGRVLFDRAEEFLPERWSEENASKLPRGQFAAFHLGPQTCLGKEMAYTEAVMVMCSILKQFKLTLADGEDRKGYVTSLILVPKDGIRFHVQARDTTTGEQQQHE